MKFFTSTRIGVLIGAAVLCVQGQETPKQETPRKETPPEFKGIPPRATPADYQFNAIAGTVTIAAEFTGHDLPTADGPLTTEDYVAVETALFGPAGAKLRISSEDFSLRINGKKTPLPSQPFGSVFSSLRDPEWIAPETEQKSKTSMSSGGGQKGDSSGPPPPVKIPVPLQRAMAQRVQKAALPEGDRALPQAGLIFFSYRSKTKNLQSIQLIYNGPAGKAVLDLHQ